MATDNREEPVGDPLPAEQGEARMEAGAWQGRVAAQWSSVEEPAPTSGACEA
jgi:hypothetical protein